MDHLDGKHALVTGGARGIGLAIARELLRQGAAVTLTGRDEAALDAAVATLAPLGIARRVRMDVADPASVGQGMADAARTAGRIDILVNNAGQAESAAVGKTDDALWARMLAVNLSGTFYCSRAVLPGMLEAGWGRIVNVASTAGLIGYTYTAAYCASKHGVVGLTRAMALEVAAKGVTVNAVCPGFTETDLGREAIANISARTGRSEAESKAALAAFNPQKRLVQPDEVANAAVWLCLPASAAMNGQAIAVAGGEVT
ncbi:3-hydroxyacyl-CoA dehydrogenase [Pigmentiphaga sp. NML080357]|uniref:SDR family NAD(P)-dependent oxidoreductase n=1 Tax=Pigmentiphaga sp. NML080357 TaxID=2008675 RepID=UPI000B41186B|nr:SDR family NAD(P)-dependent oxidoreductase [Pigmentiphaga sp. NML080357]OVZ62983.1 3-hydroxyacyl-CoA dehydrogenase [Pigmentiphaga sp. NML080357]